MYTVLEKVVAPPRLEYIEILNGIRNIEWVFAEHPSNEVMAIDLETKGTDPLTPDNRVVGVGLSDSRGSVYIPIENDSEFNWVQDQLLKHDIKLIAHNVMFDGLWMRPEMWKQFEACTYMLFKMLATEGFPEQSWSLKQAQIDLLSWEETNEVELDKWLIKNNYITNGPRQKQDESFEEFEERYIAWLRESDVGPRVDKSQMWRAPHNILGHYCALDADSTYLIYTQVFGPALERFEVAKEFLLNDYMHLITRLLQNYHDGIYIDRQELLCARLNLQDEIADARHSFFNHPEVKKYVDEYNAAQIEKLSKKEPARYTKAGKLSKNWTKWKDKYTKALRTNHFNLNSGPQKEWLFYEKLGYPERVFNDKGKRQVDKKALKGFGEPGNLLRKYNDLWKVDSYIETCLEKIDKNNILHPLFRAPGTLSGRLGGSGGFNVQQQPKHRGYLECWHPPEGYVWVDVDFTSLEQIVLAELSKDPTLWTLYGPGAKQNDVYLFNGAHMPGLDKTIRDSGYDPYNPTPESIAHTKKVCKKERGISKVLTLGQSYGMGPKKLRATLALEGTRVSEDEAYRLWQSYWDLYAGVKVYESELKRQWRKNNGWVLNGIGRPVGVHHTYEKDLVNRVVQSTGHDLLVIWVRIWSEMLEQRKIPWSPVIVDYHDESLIQVPAEYADEVVAVMEKESFAKLNKLLQPEIPLKGDGGLVASLAQAKLEG